MEIPFADLYQQYLSIKDEIDAAIKQVIVESGYIKGRFVEKFENEFAAHVGIKNCIGCANGTDAIEVALRALEIGSGDEVIVPANTWISTAEAVTSVGAKVVFVDNHPDFYTIDVEKIEEKITPRTKAIIPVHLYGLPAEMDSILGIAKKHKLKIIEDCAQAHDALYRGKKVATFGDMATFSFFPGKNLGAYGDAGAIVTADDDLAKRCRMIGDHGRLGKFDHGLEGRNSRLDGLQAAILSAKLPFLEQWTALRRRYAQIYDRLLMHKNLQMPIAPDYSLHVYHLYVIRVSAREKLQALLQSQGIMTGIHYPTALPLLTAYRYLGHKASDFPIASHYMSQILSLPMYAELDNQRAEKIAEAVLKALEVN